LIRQKVKSLIFVSLLCSTSVYAQVNVDSLKQVVQTSTDAKDKVDALNKLGFEFRNTDSEQAKTYLNQSLKLSYDTDYQQGYGQALNNLGCLFQVTGKIDSSLIVLNQAIAVFESKNLTKESGKTCVNLAITHYYLGDIEAAIRTAEEAIPMLGNNKKRIASTYANIGLFYRNLGKYPEGVQNYVRALIIFSELGLKEREIDTRNNIGMLYQAYRQHEKSLEYHEQALEDATAINYTSGLAHALGGLGVVYRSLNKFDEALSASQKASKYFKDLSVTRMYANSLLNLGHIYADLKENEKAMAFYQQADTLYISLNDLRGIAAINGSIGTIYFELKQFENALQYYSKAHENVQHILERNILKSLYINMANACEQLGMKDQSLVFHHRYNDIKDSIFNLEAVEKMTEIETKYQVEVKEAELTEKELELKESKTSVNELWAFISRLWYLFGALVVSLIVVVIAFVRKRAQTKALKIQKDEMVNKYDSLEEAYQNIYNAFEKIVNKPEGNDPEAARPDFPQYLTQLSKRELEVLSCLSIGLTDKEIADKLFISVTTVRTHCRRIYEKLQVKNRAEAANFAREYQLI
jgi:tetratricopeptide (TPR) repeat protein